MLLLGSVRVAVLAVSLLSYTVPRTRRFVEGLGTNAQRYEPTVPDADRTAFPTPSQLGQIGAGENPVKNPRGCSSLPLSDGGSRRSAMAPSLTDGTGTPIPAISLTLEPSAHSP